MAYHLYLPGNIRLSDAQCPRDDRAYVIDENNQRYQIGCSSETLGGPENVQDVLNSFKDCFNYCDNSLDIYGIECTSCYYKGGENGIGSG